MTHSTPEEYFVKVNGRYQSVGTSRPDYLPNGLYFHQNIPSGTRTTSVQHWVGTDPKQPIDLNRLLSLMQQDEKLMTYLAAIQTEDSPEYKKLKVDCAGYVKNPPRIYNISMHDLATAVLRFLFQEEVDDRTPKRNAL